MGAKILDSMVMIGANCRPLADADSDASVLVEAKFLKTLDLDTFGAPYLLGGQPG